MPRLLFCAILLMLSGISVGADIRGRLELSSDGKKLRPAEAVDAVIYFRTKQAVKAEPAPAPAVMGTRRKQFTPRVLAITAGSQVRFPNEDPILHNAFSSSTDNAFDAGLYGQGDGYLQTFNRPGHVRIYCNVHHSMVGHIIVLDTPFFARPDANGDFRLADLPDVEGDLVVWHERATPWRRTMKPSDQPQLVVKFDLSKRRVPPHMNKFGKPYGRSGNANY